MGGVPELEARRDLFLSLPGVEMDLPVNVVLSLLFMLQSLSKQGGPGRSLL